MTTKFVVPEIRTLDGSCDCANWSGGSICGWDFEAKELTESCGRLSESTQEDIVEIKAGKLGSFTVPAEARLYVSECGRHSMSAAYIERDDHICGLSSSDKLEFFVVKDVQIRTGSICVVYSANPFLLRIGKRSLLCSSS